MKTIVQPKTGIISVVIDTASGKRTISTGCTNPVEAQQVIDSANVASIEALAKANALSQAIVQKLVVGANVTVEAAVAQWEQWIRSVSGSDRTADNHVMFVRAWMRDAKCAKRKIGTIAEPDISGCINRNDGTKLASRRVKLAAIRSLFSFCSIRQYTNGDPSREVRIKAKLLSHEQKEPRHKTCFTEKEIECIVSYLSDEMLKLDLEPDKTPAQEHRLKTMRFWYCAVLIGRYAGLRLGDICSLERASLAKPGKLIVWTDKRDTRVELNVDDDLAKGIAAIPKASKKFCFPAQDAITRGPQRAKLSVQFSRILASVKIEGHSFHDLRHTFCSDCKRRGISLPHIAKLVGHSDEETTKGYLH
jgi:site-specific recombinase XerD